MSTKLVLILYSVGVALAFEVSMMQYHFWFKDKIHKNWISDTYENELMLTCAVRCQNSAGCIGLALGPLQEGSENFSRQCHLLSHIDERECDQDYDCAEEGVQIYSKEKPITTTTEEIISSTVESSTTTTTTESEIDSTTSTAVTVTESTTVTTTTSSSTEPTTSTTTESAIASMEPTTTTTEATITTTTQKPTTTTQEPTTTTQEPTTTAQEPTTTTKEPKTTTKEPTTTTTTTLKATTTTTQEPTTTTEEQTTTTTTTTQEPTTTTTTTTQEPTTTTTTTTQEPTTTTATTTTSTTTTTAPTTTTEQPTTTIVTTTKEPTTTTVESTTTEQPETTTEEFSETCTAQPLNITCPQPRTQMVVTGMRSSFPLFSDASLEVECTNYNLKNILEAKSRKDIYPPFSGEFVCEEGEIMTGIEFCFEVHPKYIAPYCTKLESGYKLSEEIQSVSSSTDSPEKVFCPDKTFMLTMQLDEDDDGNIRVFLKCVGIEQQTM